MLSFVNNFDLCYVWIPTRPLPHISIQIFPSQEESKLQRTSFTVKIYLLYQSWDTVNTHLRIKIKIKQFLSSLLSGFPVVSSTYFNLDLCLSGIKPAPKNFFYCENIFLTVTFKDLSCLMSGFQLGLLLIFCFTVKIFLEKSALKTPCKNNISGLVKSLKNQHDSLVKLNAICLTMLACAPLSTDLFNI